MIPTWPLDSQRAQSAPDVAQALLVGHAPRLLGGRRGVRRLGARCVAVMEVGHERGIAVHRERAGDLLRGPVVAVVEDDHARLPVPSIGWARYASISSPPWPVIVVVRDDPVGHAPDHGATAGGDADPAIGREVRGPQAAGAALGTAATLAEVGRAHQALLHRPLVVDRRRHLVGQSAAASPGPPAPPGAAAAISPARARPPTAGRRRGPTGQPDPQGLLAVDAAARGQQLERGLRADDRGQRHRDAEAGVEAQQREVAGEAGLGRHHPEVRSEPAPGPADGGALHGGHHGQRLAEQPHSRADSAAPRPPPKSAPAEVPPVAAQHDGVGLAVRRQVLQGIGQPADQVGVEVVVRRPPDLDGGHVVGPRSTTTSPPSAPARSSAGTYQRAGGSPKSGVAGQVAEHRGPLGGRFRAGPGPSRRGCCAGSAGAAGDRLGRTDTIGDQPAQRAVGAGEQGVGPGDPRGPRRAAGHVAGGQLADRSLRPRRSASPGQPGPRRSAVQRPARCAASSAAISWRTTGSVAAPWPAPARRPGRHVPPAAGTTGRSRSGRPPRPPPPPRPGHHPGEGRRTSAPNRRSNASVVSATRQPLPPRRPRCRPGCGPRSGTPR